MFSKSLVSLLAPSLDIQSLSPQKKSILILGRTSRMISSMLRKGCRGHPNKLQNPPSLLQSILQICLKQRCQADFYSSANFNLPVSTRSINLLPIQKVSMTFDGRKPQLNIFSAMQKKNREFLALSAMVYAGILPEPAAERKIICLTLSGYFSRQRLPMYPPKLCPARINSFMPTVFLHSSIASMQQIPVCSGVIFSCHFPLDDSPTPNVSSAWIWKWSLRCSKVLMKVSEEPPQP